MFVFLVSFIETNLNIWDRYYDRETIATETNAVDYSQCRQNQRIPRIPTESQESRIAETKPHKNQNQS